MYKTIVFVFQTFFLSSLSYAGTTVVRPGSLPETFKAMHKAAESLNKFIHGGASDLISLVPFAITRQIAQVIQEGEQKAEKMNEEIRKRDEQLQELFRHEKNQTDVWEERQQTIRELREKILEAHYTLRQNKDEQTVEDMEAELWELLSKPPKSGLLIDDDNEETGWLAPDLKPGELEQAAVVGNYIVPGVLVAPLEINPMSQEGYQRELQSLERQQEALLLFGNLGLGDPHVRMANRMQTQSQIDRLVAIQTGHRDGCTQITSIICCSPLCFFCAVARLLGDRYHVIDPQKVPGIEECAYGGRCSGNRYKNVQYGMSPPYGTGYTQRTLDRATVCCSISLVGLVGGISVYDAATHTANGPATPAPTVAMKMMEYMK